MAENNAVTKEELREILAEMVKELRRETAAQFEAADRKTAARFEEYERKNATRFEEMEKRTAARFEESERKTAARFEESERKTAARFEEMDIKTEARFEESERKTAARFEESERKTTGRFEEINQNIAVLSQKVDANDQKLEVFRAEVMVRFDSADIKHANVVTEILQLRSDFEAHKKTNDENQSKLLTGMDKVMKEVENHRIERMSFNAIQDRHTRDIEAIQKHLGLESSNGNHLKNAKVKKPPTRGRKKSK